MSDLAYINHILKERANKICNNTSLDCQSQSLWEISSSLLGGEGQRGIFATEDISPGTLILIDNPLLFGPRAAATCGASLCVCCYKKYPIRVRPCSKGCGLPLCSDECENTIEHRKECECIRKWQMFPTTNWSLNLMRALIPIRSLLLNEKEREILFILKGHCGNQHGYEVKLLKNVLDVPIDEEDEFFMKKVCTILDANAFRTVVVHGEEKTSLRGVYPLASLINHDCVPNTMHVFDSERRMHVRAAKHIAKGEELTETYSNLFWSTHARRHNLLTTKFFLCACNRCADPTECGTYLAALKCADEDCAGVIIPTNPLLVQTNWKCLKCEKTVSHKDIEIIHSSLSGIIDSLCLNDPKTVQTFLSRHLVQGIPETNRIALELKLFLISNLGDYPEYNWNDLSDETLEYKEKLCHELLQLMSKMNAGLCAMRGYILFELHLTLVEKVKRLPNQNNCNTENIKAEAEKYLKEAAYILRNDVTAPVQIQHMLV